MLPRPHVAGLRWTEPHQWHVTLRFLGRTDVGEAVAAFRRIAVASPVEAVLGPATARFGRRVVHVPVHGLEALAEATVAATAGVGQPPEDRPFVGHLTLARAADRRGVDLRPLTGTALAGRWTVDELALMSSHLHPRGARYEVVETLPLAEGP